jgi:alkanesulfonate monooxygenase SsuD/methylene tetrahydromethanopterin reductase-like flavin-dependent oxidoreductase (luciferase family)
VSGPSLPIAVTIRTIRADPVWWLESARRLDEAGYAGVYAWDHFMGQGDKTVPVVECWTILAMAAASTRRVTVGPFVVNVMNRHPAVLARMASTLQVASGGRLVLGMGIGGAPREHAAYGIDFPAPPERVARLEEAVAVIRALWTGGPITRASPYYPLTDATAFPLPDPPPPIIIGGETPAGARLAGRIGDGWSAFDDNFEQNLPLYLEALAATGRSRASQRVLVGFQGDWLGDADVAETEWVREPRAAWERWHEIGADGAIVLARTTADVDALVEAVARWS